jgi:hypothetical protein
MNSSEKKINQPGEGPDTIGALRDWLAPKKPKKMFSAADDSAPISPVQAIAEEFDPTPRIRDLYGPAPAASNWPKDLARDSGTDMPVFVDPLREETTTIPEFLEPEPPQETPQKSRPSLTGRVFRTAMSAVVVIGLASVALALLSNKEHGQDDNVRSAETVTRALQPQASPARDESSLAQRQLDMMASDVAALRGVVEQLSMRQEKMTQDVGSLQTSLQNLSQRVTALSQDVARIEQSQPRRRHSSRR